MTSIPLIESINEHIINPIMAVLFALALLYFAFGIVQYIRNADSDEGRQTGSKHIIWGIIGMAIIVAAFGIMNVICRTIGC
jgi:uncharacterized membrane protein YidH (DUF202 family)